MFQKLRFTPFSHFIQNNTEFSSVKRSYETTIMDLKVQPEGSLTAIAWGTHHYKVTVLFNRTKVITTRCECPYDGKGVCKHVIRVIYEADEKVADYYDKRFPKQPEKKTELIEENGGLRLPEIFWDDLDDDLLDDLKLFKSTNRWFSPYNYHWGEGSYLLKHIDAIFHHEGEEVQIEIKEDPDGMFFKCSCKAGKHNFCSHLSKALEQRNTSLF